MSKSFYNVSQRVLDTSKESLIRKLSEQNVVTDQIAHDNRSLIFKTPEVVDYFHFSLEDFIIDDYWHQLDLSQYVPRAAKKVVIWWRLNGTANQRFRLAPYLENVPADPGQNHYHLRTQVSGISIDANIEMPIDRNSTISYRSDGSGLTALTIQIIGWWE